jgi:hypothetical protein
MAVHRKRKRAQRGPKGLPRLTSAGLPPASKQDQRKETEALVASYLAIAGGEIKRCPPAGSHLRGRGRNASS